MKTKPILMAVILLLAFICVGNAHSGMIVYLTPMPMPTQYRNLDQYHQALKVWENVHKKIVARNRNIQLPPMPIPAQYRNLDQYQQAFKVWERVGSTPIGDSYAGDSNIIWLTPMPMPTQYNKMEHYQQALTAWITVSQNTVARSANVQPPQMPMPTQYQKLEYYQKALQAWEQVFE